MYNDNHSNYKLYYPDFSSYLYRYVHELEDAAEPKQPKDFDQINIAKWIVIKNVAEGNTSQEINPEIKL